MASKKQQEIYGVPDEAPPEWTAEDFANAKPFSELFPELYAKRSRGKQKAETKELISLRLDREALAKFRALGPGWQKRISEVVTKAAAELS